MHSICPLFSCHLGEKVHGKKTSFRNGVASLFLANCSSENAGMYTCIAENSAGKQSSSAVLHITGKAEVLFLINIKWSLPYP